MIQQLKKIWGDLNKLPDCHLCGVERTKQNFAYGGYCEDCWKFMRFETSQYLNKNEKRKWLALYRLGGSSKKLISNKKFTKERNEFFSIVKKAKKRQEIEDLALIL